MFLVGQAQVADDASVLRRIFDPAVIAGRTAWLAPESGVQAPVSSDDAPAGACTLDSYSNDQLQATCQVQRPALAVFVEQHDKGWRATVDGHPAPIARANLIMRAVADPRPDAPPVMMAVLLDKSNIKLGSSLPGCPLY